jgi:FtsZ-binding cell division protein ZapB
MFDLKKELFYKSIFDKLLNKYDIEYKEIPENTSDGCFNFIVTNIQQNHNQECEQLKKENEHFKNIIHNYQILNSCTLDPVSKTHYENLIKSYMLLIIDNSKLENKYNDSINYIDKTNGTVENLKSKEQKMNIIMDNLQNEINKMKISNDIPFKEINKFSHLNKIIRSI